jgi:hypothetical protein
MKSNLLNKAVLAVAVGSAFAMSGAAMAETGQTVGAGNISAAARQDFRVIIPRFITFTVGVAGAGFSLVECDLSAVAPALIGAGADQACTGGNVGGGVSDVTVRSNAGPINIVASTTGDLSNGTDTMPFSEILTSSSDGANFPAPVLTSPGSSPAVNVAVTSGANVTNRTAQWTYTFNNSALYASGTYGGVNTNNGRVTYTAANF